MIELWRALAFGAVMFLCGLLVAHWREVLAVDDERERGSEK
ncbi:hypothetical protein [Lacticaseibacillus sharpeae]|nr:hypothetical protein [Lacticaseibacillus sharpeae]